MPVVSIETARFAKMVGAPADRVIERLPFIGLDIEGVSKDSVRVEYSPNRPDFGTDYGIARALRGLLGLEVGLPVYKVDAPAFKVEVDPRLAKVRPWIGCTVVRGLSLDDEDVRQVISLQEDLHNGLGRKRRRVSIGLHDMSKVKPPIRYWGEAASFSFVPLDRTEKMRLGQILRETETGRTYGHILSGASVYPVLKDAAGTVLSFPPIINGAKTKVTKGTRDIFVDVTSTKAAPGEDALAVMASTLADMGGRLESVEIRYSQRKSITPDLAPREFPLDRKLIREVTGLELTASEIDRCLGKSRLGVNGNKAVIPRYRTDILHPVDLAEETALGYGIDRIGPLYPPSDRPGSFNSFDQFLDKVSDILAGSGMVEVMTYELSDRKTVYANFGRDDAGRLEVEEPKSMDHSVLRDSLIPTLMATLAANAKEEYPQRVFEIGRVYHRSPAPVSEEWSLCCLLAHSRVTYSEAKMHLAAFLKVLLGSSPSTPPADHWAFAKGRTAGVKVSGKSIGFLGEIGPDSLESFGIAMPVAGFELSLSTLGKHLK